MTIESARSPLAALFGKLSPAARARLALAAALAVVAVWLVVADKPWEIGLFAKDKPSLSDFVGFYTWWGGLAAAGGLALLLASAGWWTRPLPPAVLRLSRAEEAALAKPRPRWFLPWVLGAMAVAAVLGAMRLDFSLWDDEEYSMRRSVWGVYEEDGKGGVVFQRLKWRKTLFHYKKPNNHILYSILARLSLEGWALAGGGRDGGLPFSERAMRLPAYVFGVLSVGALAWFLLELGMARAGVFAAWLLALHPWHIRYASEARGYSLILFLLPLLWIAYGRAVREPLWRWWILMAVCSFGILYAFPAALVPVAAAHAAAILLILLRRPRDAAPWIPLGRWLACSMVAGLAFLWLFLPCMAQVTDYLERTIAGLKLGDWWLRNFFSHLLAGVAWFDTNDLLAPQPELKAFAMRNPSHFQAVLALAMLGLVLGSLRMLARGAISRTLLAVLLAPAVVTYLAAWKAGAFLYVWYLIYLLPGVVAVWAAGWDMLDAPLRRWPAGRWLAPAGFAAAMSVYLGLVSDSHFWLLTRSIQPIRESALLVRGTILPNHPGHENILTASFNTPAFLYDPHFHQVD
ncbi:MAG: hypothetical protein N2322_04075, partial [Terrimicrobiaceae bacterium]|nr:hypothetical protein [Terrimicrobiaceae bacterium]